MTAFINLPKEQAFLDLTSKQDLIAYFTEGCKPRGQWCIGVEHEQFVVHPETLSPILYEGDRGIAVVLQEFTNHGWQAVKEDGCIVGLKQKQMAITTEPGGQFELSGSPLHTLHENAAELYNYNQQLHSVLKKLNLTTLMAGFHPYATRDDFSLMPKERYKIMYEYMPTKSDLGIDMMFCSCGVQVNLDFADEQDMIKKMRVSMALQPIIMALFANSSIIEGKPSGYATWRSHIWLHTDPDRCGMLPFVFDDDFSFDRYTDYALQVPMYLIIRDNKILNVAGCSFYDFLQGKLPGYPGLMPTMADWALHLTTLFPDVRLKQYIEMRGADSESLPMTMALSALWVGLLYDQDNLSHLVDLTQTWSLDDILRLRFLVCHDGLEAQSGQLNAREIADFIIYIAQKGLERRQLLSDQGQDESIYLAPLCDKLTTLAADARGS